MRSVTQHFFSRIGHAFSVAQLGNQIQHYHNINIVLLDSPLQHHAAKYPEFVERYRAELDENPLTASFISQVAEQLTKTNVILLFGAKDEQHNQAVVLRDYLKDSGQLPTA